jgi:aryl-alcohol dehydrogenase-like predicted oxidoreductase
VVCVQNNYNLAYRHDDALIDDLARQGIAYVPFFPLGGFTPLQSSTLSCVADRIGATPMQVALAWLLHRSPNILLIPGTSSVAHLRENLAVGQLTLTPQSLAELRRHSRRGERRGTIRVKVSRGRDGYTYFLPPCYNHAANLHSNRPFIKKITLTV